MADTQALSAKKNRQTHGCECVCPLLCRYRIYRTLLEGLGQALDPLTGPHFANHCQIRHLLLPCPAINCLPLQLRLALVVWALRQDSEDCSQVQVDERWPHHSWRTHQPSSECVIVAQWRHPWKLLLSLNPALDWFHRSGGHPNSSSQGSSRTPQEGSPPSGGTGSSRVRQQDRETEPASERMLRETLEQVFMSVECPRHRSCCCCFICHAQLAPPHDARSLATLVVMYLLCTPLVD